MHTLFQVCLLYRLEGTSNYFNSNQNDVNAGDSVASGSIEQQKKWASNSFNLYKVGETRTDPYWSQRCSDIGNPWLCQLPQTRYPQPTALRLSYLE